MAGTVLDANLTGNGNTSAVTAKAAFNNGNATYQVIASGTFGSGTLTLQYSADGSTWVSTSTTFTAAGSALFEVAPEVQFRLNLAGATTPNIGVDVF